MKSSLSVLLVTLGALSGLACLVVPSNSLSLHLLVVGMNAIMSAVVDGALGEIAGNIVAQLL